MVFEAELNRAVLFDESILVKKSETWIVEGDWNGIELPQSMKFGSWCLVVFNEEICRLLIACEAYNFMT